MIFGAVRPLFRGDQVVKCGHSDGDSVYIETAGTTGQLVEGTTTAGGVGQVDQDIEVATSVRQVEISIPAKVCSSS